MGTMINGVWRTDDEIAATDPDGRWHRAKSIVRNWVTPDGAPGPTGTGGFVAEPGRYHLYVAWNCPWAHRSLLARLFKRLEDIVPISIAAPRRTGEGWVFEPSGEFADRLFGAAALHEVYARGVGDYTGRVTVPVLFDTRTGRMVSNESADIVRMFNSAFAAYAPETPDLYPEPLRAAVDSWNARIHATLNNGVYRAGFAASQNAYEEAFADVFETLDAIEARLAASPFLAGDAMTEADLRLFPTLTRFDVAYHVAFKCNLRRITDYPHLWAYARRIFAMPGVAPMVRFDIYKRGYFSPSARRNPNGIVPCGPAIDWSVSDAASESPH